VETVGQFAKRLTAAIGDVEAGNCKPYGAIRVAPLVGCGQLGRVLRGFKVISTESFGQAAVVSYTVAHPVRGTTSNVDLATLDAHGKFVVMVDEARRKPETGTKAADPAKFLSAFRGWLKSIATRNCDAYYAYSEEPPGSPPKAAWCKTGLAPGVVKSYAPSKIGTIRALGGTAHYQFVQLVHPGSPALTFALGYNPDTPRDQYGVYTQGVNGPAPAGAKRPPVAGAGGYTAAVKARYVKNCASGGESSARCQCEIDAIASKVPYADFKTPTPVFDRALPAIKRACKTHAQ
jgi:hypothetical protein